jgi:hypothetical protein
MHAGDIATPLLCKDMSECKAVSNLAEHMRSRMLISLFSFCLLKYAVTQACHKECQHTSTRDDGMFVDIVVILCIELHPSSF